jgi:hypothetical protein
MIPLQEAKRQTSQHVLAEPGLALLSWPFPLLQTGVSASHPLQGRLGVDLVVVEGASVLTRF